jgi:hypothetical protein
MWTNKQNFDVTLGIAITYLYQVIIGTQFHDSIQHEENTNKGREIRWAFAPKKMKDTQVFN